MRILVLCGTHTQPFERLVDAAAALAAAGHQVTVQRGVSTCPAPGCDVVDVVPPAALDALADAADLIVGHAAPGTTFLAWDRGRRPVVVPRRAALGEHVDDHQVAFAARVAGRVIAVGDPADLVAVVAALRGVPPAEDRPDPAPSAAFVREFASLADRLVDEARRGRRKHARVRDVLLSLGLRPR